ncbi:MAG: class I SAM-dependent methyltransferase [Patescibacteria group bacterium]|nr:class I SAM-dependent methyltransferase [Patescibacteria group bacterium]
MKQNRLDALKKIVADSYELTAGHFNDTRSKVAAPDFQWAAKQINSHDQVFDAGCGNGRLLDYAPISSANYLGFDQSNKLLSFARRQHPGYQFKSGDLSKLQSVAPASFSVIFCSAVLSHMPGRKERIDALHSFYNLSLPGGRLIISFWKMKGKYRRQLWHNWWKKLTGHYPYDWNDLIFPWKDQKGQAVSARYYYCYSRRRFKKDILAAGWKIERIYDDVFNYWVVAVKNN